MRYEAVIFDLFGTLVNDSVQTFPALLQREAVLGPLTGGRGGEFARLWKSRDVRRMRTLGILDTPTDAIRYVCEQMNAKPADVLVERAVELRMDYCLDRLTERPGVVETLARIRAKGRKMALTCTCDADTPWLWPRTELARYFDETLFSCQVGLAKPHPQFFELACIRLGVRADRCLYVGDGDRRELIGAVEAGMDAALLADATDDAADNWNGARITSIEQVMDLLTNGTAMSMA